MARTVRDSNLESRTARLRLAPAGKPYWRLIEGGLHVGYRRRAKGGGTWVGRRFLGAGKYAELKVGTADDFQDADGTTIVTFSQAQDAVRNWGSSEQRKALGLPVKAGPYSIADALGDYFSARERAGSKGLKSDRSVAASRIIPDLGALEVAKITTKRIRDWHTALAAAPKFVRTGKLRPARSTKPHDEHDVEALRARRASANRILTVLKAALNHAYRDGHCGTDEPWRRVKPFKGADAPVVRAISAAECLRLVKACEPDFRDLVRAALVTGCRYGELTRMRVGDFNQGANTITVRLSKSGKARHVALASEGQRLFEQLTIGRASAEPIFVRADGRIWGASQQQRPLATASKAARVEPAVNFHIPRHTYASTLAMKGVSMAVIAAQLGHSDTRMTERHYAHLAPSYVADTIRAALTDFGFVESPSVLSLRLPA